MPAGGASSRILPDGSLDLIWIDGTLVVAGPDTAAHLAVGTGGAHFVGLRFAPGTGPTVLGVPAAELRDRRLPLADLWTTARARRLADRITGAPDRGLALESVVADLLAEAGPPDPLLAAVAGYADQAHLSREVRALTGVTLGELV